MSLDAAKANEPDNFQLFFCFPSLSKNERVYIHSRKLRVFVCLRLTGMLAGFVRCMYITRTNALDARE